MNTEIKPFRVLSLDGGGGKGVYTLGVLKEVEQLLGTPLQRHFDLFYGTSTGSIIATALATGASVDTIIEFYLKRLPHIMKTFTVSRRSESLRSALVDFFGDKKFDAIPVPLGIVATNLDERRAIVFKSFGTQAHGMKSSFVAGFGVTLADAIEASCSAHPFFSPKVLNPTNSPTVNVVDGGFVANNPALYALVDARKALNVDESALRFLSIGTGSYPEKYPVYSYLQAIRLKPTLEMISMQFAANSNSVETIFRLLTAGVKSVRVSDAFSDPELTTSLFESREKTLNRLIAKGRWSFGNNENAIRELLTT